MIPTPFKRTEAQAPELESALAAWKQRNSCSEALTDEVLPDVARSRILARARDGRMRTESPLATLFFPFRRLMLVGALPLVLLTAMVGYLAHQGLATTPGLKNAPNTPIFASKAAGEVIFTIANGDRAHKVYLSTAPDRFENAPAILTRDGAFRDSLNGGPDLVFYRID